MAVHCLNRESKLPVASANPCARMVFHKGEPVQDQQTPDDVAAARAQEYVLLATLLGRAPDAKLLESLAALRGDATPLGVAHAALAQAASETTVERVEHEHFNLFIGLGRGGILPYG